uniref:hypothetical protein n=1 Tax=Methylibium rhizosphaerae TaxID=2570323 RepID=UPI001C6115EC
FGNALGSSLAAESTRGSQQEDVLGQFIDEQLQAQDRRDFYSPMSGSDAPYMRLGRSDLGSGAGGGAGLPEQVATADDRMPRPSDRFVSFRDGPMGPMHDREGDRLRLQSVGGDDVAGVRERARLSNELNRLQRNVADLKGLAAALETDRALANMADLAESYRASGMTGATGDPLTFEMPEALAGAGLKPPTEGFSFGLSGGQRSVLDGPMSFSENAGLFTRGLVTGPVTAAYGLASEIGNQYKDMYNLLSGSSASYTPSSALLSSLQRDGIGGTLLNMGESVLSAPSKPVFDLLEGRYEQAGAGLPGTVAMGAGAAIRLGGLGGSGSVSLSELRELRALGLSRDGRRAFVEGFDLGLGLSRDPISGQPLLREFASANDLHVYNVFRGERNLFTAPFPASYEALERNLTMSMDRARSISVNLDGLVQSVDEFPTILERGARGIEPAAVRNGLERGNTTNWEVWKVYNSSTLRPKATFYLNGQPVELP